MPLAQTIQIQSSAPGTRIAYSTAITPAAPWLNVSAAGGSTPGSVSVSLTAQALALAASPTPYTTTVVFTCAASTPCSGTQQTVNVSLTVASPPAQLSVLNGILAFSASATSPQTVQQSLGLQNTGGGTVGIGSISGSASWIHVGAYPSALRSGPATSVIIAADPSGLAPDYYRGTVTIASSTGTAIVPVTMLITSVPSMVLSPAGTQLLMSVGGNPPAGGSFAVSVSGAAPVAWTAGVQPGASWLTLGSSSGTSSGNAPSGVNFSIDPAATASLVSGNYYGTIRVASNQVVNSPQDYQVILTVAPGTSPQVPNPTPQGLIFIGTATTSIPAQAVQVGSGGSASLTYQATASSSDGRSWLTVNPATGTATAAAPATSTITVNPAGLAAGTYRGGVSYAGSGASVRTVNVTLVVTNSLADRDVSFKPAATCNASQLSVAGIDPVSGFSVASSLPTPVSVRLLNDCGDPVTSGQVVASFSNGDPSITLPFAGGSGVYAGTWTPRRSAAQVTISVAAQASGLIASTEFKGSVSTGSAPSVVPQGTLHVFNPLIGGALAPGTIVQIYGTNLASQTASASAVPLPATLGGASVTIGGIAAPLYFVSPGQINAQVPFGLATGRQYQVVVNSGGVPSTPDSIQLVDAAPGIAALASGGVIAQHGDGTLVSATAPAKAGEFLVVYLAGLGATDNAVATGAGSPTSPLAAATAVPSVSLNGIPASVYFAGMTPGLVGLYQINFQVPASAPNGDLALAVSQGSLSANTTTLTVKN